MTTHTIITAKGRYTGTLREVCAWQGEMQASFARIDGVEVDDIDFDPEDLGPAVRAVRAALAAAAEAARSELARDAIASIPVDLDAARRACGFADPPPDPRALSGRHR